MQRAASSDRTRPGPASTYCSTPSESSVVIVSRQRTGEMSASASSVAGSANSVAVAQLMTGISGVSKTRAGEHDLAGSVVVCQADAVAGGALRGLVGRRAHQREHRPAAGGLARGGHVVAAQDDEAQRIVVREGAHCSQRRELAERVARQRDGIDVVAQTRPPCKRGTQDRRLCEAGGLLDPRKRILADELAGRIEEIGTNRGHEGAHVRCLAALSREQDSGLA